MFYSGPVSLIGIGLMYPDFCGSFQNRILINVAKNFTTYVLGFCFFICHYSF